MSDCKERRRYEGYTPHAVVLEQSRWVEIRILLERVKLLNGLIKKGCHSPTEYMACIEGLLEKSDTIFNETTRFPQDGWYLPCDFGHWEDTLIHLKEVCSTAECCKQLPDILRKIRRDVAEGTEIYSQEVFESSLKLKWITKRGPTPK